VGLAVSVMADLGPYGEVFDNLGRLLGMAARTYEEGWSTLIMLPAAFFYSEPKKGLQCAVGPCCPTVFDEFARVDLNVDDAPVGVELKKQIIALAAHHAVPFLEGFGKVVCGNGEEGRIIFRSDFWQPSTRHFEAPQSSLPAANSALGTATTKNAAAKGSFPDPVSIGIRAKNDKDFGADQQDCDSQSLGECQNPPSLGSGDMSGLYIGPGL
jgi:hypothetical protein